MAVAIANDGVRLFWSIEGPDRAPVIVLSHSIGCDSTMWAPQIALLDGDYRLLVHDTRGHGRSGAPAEDYSLSVLASDLVAILNAAGVDRVHLCGLSLGGAVAQRFALDHPARLNRLILANTASRIGTAEGWAQRIQAVQEGGMASIADMAMARFFSAEFAERSPQTVETLRSVFLRTSAQGYRAACAALRDADLTSELGRLSHRTLVIGGAVDVSTPPDQTNALAKGVQDGRHLLLDAAHLSNVEQPDGFTAAISRFLKP